MKTIGERIRYLRENEGLTLDKLADKIGLKKGSVSSYENNRYDPSAKTIVSICQEFNVSADWLLMGEEVIQQTKSQQSKIEERGYEISSEEYDLILKLRALDFDNQAEAIEIIERKYARFHKESQPEQNLSTNSRHGENDEGAATKSESA